MLVGRRFPPYHQIADPPRGATRSSRCTARGGGDEHRRLPADRRGTPSTTPQRWIAEGVPGWPTRAMPAPRPAQGRSAGDAAVKRLQENPELGAFRIHAALKQQGIELSPRTCGRILARNRKLYGLAKPARAPRTKTPKPFAADAAAPVLERGHPPSRHGQHRHEGLLRLHLGELLAAPSWRAASSRRRISSAYLMILYAAIRQHGVPETLVSDSGAVFVTAKQAKAIYAALGIEKREIERGKPWQNYIETTFNVQRRMADWDFAKATTWAELLAVHDQWVVDYNYQSPLGTSGARR